MAQAKARKLASPDCTLFKVECWYHDAPTWCRDCKFLASPLRCSVCGKQQPTDTITICPVCREKATPNLPKSELSLEAKVTDSHILETLVTRYLDKHVLTANITRREIAREVISFIKSVMKPQHEQRQKELQECIDIQTRYIQNIRDNVKYLVDHGKFPAVDIESKNPVGKHPDCFKCSWGQAAKALSREKW